MSDSYLAYWEEIKKELVGLVSPNDMFMWIERLSFYDFIPEKKILRLAAPSLFIKDNAMKFKEQMTNILSSISGYECFVEFVIVKREETPPISSTQKQDSDNEENVSKSSNDNKLLDASSDLKNINSQKPERQRTTKDGVFDDYSFESFVIGSPNEFALLTAKAVAEDPGIKYNPFFLWGESGSGKTHLLKSIEKYIREHFPSKKVLYVTSEQFTNDFVEYTSRTNRPEQFRIKYRTLDVLLLDDVQFFAGKEKTQEEMFHIFNTLYDNKKQMVFSCDKPVDEVKNLEKRLRGRFAMGVSGELGSADYELRVAILKTLSLNANINIKSDAIDYICSNFVGSIRELKGVFRELEAYSSIMKINSITLDMVISKFKNKIVKDIYATPISIDKIIQIVAEYYHLKSHDITGSNRTKSIALARQISMYISRKLTRLSSPQIGSYFGDKEHATVLYATKKIEDLLSSDPKIKNDVETLIKKISN